MADEHFDEQTPGGLAASLVASAAGATIGLVVAGPTAAAAAGVIAPPVLQSLINFLGLRFERARHKAARVLTDAAAQNKVTEDKLVETAERSPQKTELLTEAVNAAARSTTDQKLKALASAVARGVAGDDNTAAQERITVAALADIEPLHIAVMNCLLLRPPMYRSEEQWQEAMRNPRRGAYGWLPEEVAEKLPETAPRHRRNLRRPRPPRPGRRYRYRHGWLPTALRRHRIRAPLPQLASNPRHALTGLRRIPHPAGAGSAPRVHTAPSRAHIPAAHNPAAERIPDR